MPTAQGLGAGGHPCLPQLYCDAGSCPRSCTGPRAWVDEEYKALHGLKRGAFVSKRRLCLDPAIYG